MSKEKGPELVATDYRRDHVLGPPTANVVLLEYGDYQCPFCGAAHHEIKQVLQRMGDRMRYVFRHFPLVDIHPFALPAAIAAEAANRQDSFWSMHDMLFQNQRDLSPPALFDYAETIGLDLDRFREDMNDPAIIERIRDDISSGLQSGVQGTPSYHINGYKYVGPDDAHSLFAVLTAAEDQLPSPATSIREAGRQGRVHKHSRPLPRAA